MIKITYSTIGGIKFSAYSFVLSALYILHNYNKFFYYRK